jgi:hypothetical protein
MKSIIKKSLIFCTPFLILATATFASPVQIMVTGGPLGNGQHVIDLGGGGQYMVSSTSTSNGLDWINGMGGVFVSSVGTSSPIQSTGGLTPTISCPTCLVTSTGLGTLNFTTTSVGQWVNNGLYCTTSNNLSDLANTSTARTNLGLGSAATLASSNWLTVANNLSDLNNTSTARTNLGYTGGFAMSISSTGTIVFTNQGYITTSTYNANFGTAAIKPSTDFLASSTTSLNLTTLSSTGITFTNATGSGNIQANSVSSSKIIFTNATSSGNLTLAGTVSSTEVSALILANSTGVWGAYGGASACAANNHINAISATGASTCTADNPSSTIATNVNQLTFASSTNYDSAFNLRANCTSSVQNFASMIANATATVNFAVTGASTSSRQVWFVSVSTSSMAIASAVQFSALNSRTTGQVTVLAQNLSGGTWLGSGLKVNVCYVQF